MVMAAALRAAYPWIRAPLLVSAPMLGAATPSLAVNVSKAGGIGFIAGGTRFDILDRALGEAATLLSSSAPAIPSVEGTLPIGVGFQNWSCDVDLGVAAVKKYSPAVVWLFAPKEVSELQRWAEEVRAAGNGTTRIWVQVGTVQEARQAIDLAKPDALVVQGADAGGHGLARSASVISLVPETVDALAADAITNVPVLAAGGIVDGRGVAGALSLGASGAVMGTRFLAAEEAGVPRGWKREILRSEDGGVSTAKSTLGDRLKEIVGWPAGYDGRMIMNKAHADEKAGLSDEEHVAMYKQELSEGDSAWGPHGRMVAWAGTGVGLIKRVKPASEIVDEVRTGARSALRRATDASQSDGGRGSLPLLQKGRQATY